MKRILSFIFVMLFCTTLAYAEEEITFFHIPWLSDENVTLDGICEAGFIRTIDEVSSFSNENSIYLSPDEMTNYIPSMDPIYNDICLSRSCKGNIRGRIAGYPVKDIVLSFAYNGEYRLISIRIELVNFDYNDLKQKMEKVYGDGELMITDDDESLLWKGTNNSAVLLYSQQGMNSLVYGRLDAIDILSECLKVDDKDVLGL